MTKQTDKQVLTAFVEKAIGNGWKVKDSKIEFVDVAHINSINIKPHDLCWVTLRLADLIANHSFMESVFPDNLLTLHKVKPCLHKTYIKENDISAVERCSTHVGLECDPKCRYYMPAHHYHQQQLIILSPDERIEYLRKVLGV